MYLYRGARYNFWQYCNMSKLDRPLQSSLPDFCNGRKMFKLAKWHRTSPNIFGAFLLRTLNQRFRAHRTLVLLLSAARVRSGCTTMHSQCLPMQESIAERKRNFAVIVNFSSAAALDYALEEELFVRVSFDQILNQLHFLKHHLDSLYWEIWKFVKLCLHSSDIAQNTFHFDEIFFITKLKISL